jgi:hyperosmotically inducible protein
MNSVLRLTTAFAAGIAAMYYLDPATGRRRRALVRDRGVAACRDVEDFARAKSRHALGRGQGLIARVRSGLMSEPVSDPQLQARIRTRLGRLVEHPGQIDAEVSDGCVVLRGTASAEEIDAAVATIAGMRGVREVDSQLTATPVGGEVH